MFRFLGFGKRGVLEKGSFQKSPCLEILESFEILAILENPQTLENTGESDQRFRESRDFGDSRDSSSEKTPFVMTPFSRHVLAACPVPIRMFRIFNGLNMRTSGRLASSGMALSATHYGLFLLIAESSVESLGNLPKIRGIASGKSVDSL